MGQGKGGDLPFRNLWKRFGRGVVNYLKTYVSHGNYIGKRGYRNAAYIIDMMQVLEGQREGRLPGTNQYYKVSTGLDMYKKVRNSIVQALKCPFVKTVVVAMDANIARNETKDMCYYTLTKRRANCRPMVVDDNEPVIDDDTIPQGDDWTSMKMNPILRREINWYFASKFMKEVTFDLSLKGDQTVIFDNCVLRRDLRKSDPIPYYSIRVNLRNGRSIGPAEPSRKHASCINEGESSMQYFVLDLDKICGYKHDVFLLETTDQDLYDIIGLGSKYRLGGFNTLMNRTVTVIKKKLYPPEIEKKVEQQIKKLHKEICAERRKLKKTIRTWTPGKPPTNKYIEKRKSKIVTLRRKKEPYTTFVDMNVLYENIIKYYKKNHPSIADPMTYEAFLFQLSGDDFHDKPCSRKKQSDSIGYNIIADEFIENLRKYEKMLKPLIVDVIPTNSGFTISAETIEVDWRIYNKFIRNVYKRKNKTRKTPIIDPDSTETRMVIPRQIMFTMLCIRNIPYIRMKTGRSIMFDPYCLNGYWGYEKKPLPDRPNHLVCTSVKAVLIS